ncbi:MAG: PTS fructose transporter subunit IIA [Caldiserica bacterium]|nr:MAG: PTS fructose transporter subunit IIA [Caldisericota bacterium]
MVISPHLKKERIILELKSKQRDDAMKEMLEVMKGSPEITDFDGFVNDVIERENLHTTGVGDGIALPHSRSRNVKEFFLIFARSKEGIDFKAIDGKPVYLIFLMGAPQEALDVYLKVLAHINRFIGRNEELKKKLLEAETEEEIIEIIKSKEL